MATIPASTKGLRHVRKTVTFDGTFEHGESASFTTYFDVTGRVLIVWLTEYVTQSFVGTGQIGGLGTSTSYLMRDAKGAYSPSAGEWLESEREEISQDSVTRGYSGSGAWALSAPLGFWVAGGDITAGQLVVDAWYYPITDDGALTGDDADVADITAIADAVWDEADTEVASVPAANASFRQKIGWLFALARNKRTQTSTTETVYADDGTTAIATSDKTDDGTTFTRDEYQ